MVFLAPQRVDLDKSSAYECGFDAFGEVRCSEHDGEHGCKHVDYCCERLLCPPLQARQTFSVSFYLVSIMYLLFDIEICYLFPYVMCHANAQVGNITIQVWNLRPCCPV